MGNHNKPDNNKLESLELELARQIYGFWSNKFDTFLATAVSSSTLFKSYNMFENLFLILQSLIISSKLNSYNMYDNFFGITMCSNKLETRLQ